MVGFFGRWWSSPGGIGPLLGIALPLMLSSGFVSLVLFTDRSLLYGHSDEAVAAAMGGGALYWSIVCFPMGLLGYISTFVSQYRGAQKVRRIGAVYHHALVLAWLMIPFLGIAFVLSTKIFEWSGHTETMVSLEARYLRILLLGGVAVLFYGVQSGLLTGHGRTATVLVIDGISTCANIALDLLLIFGWGWIPAMGLDGAALATAVSFWLKVPIASYVIHQDRTLKGAFHVGRWHAWERSTVIRLLTFGSPVGLQMLAEAGCFTIIILQVGKLGEFEMAATTLALSFNMVALVPMVGLGIGVGVLVGQRLTEGNLQIAKRTVVSAIAVSVAYTGFFAVLFGFAPDIILNVYSWGTPDDRFEVMRPTLVVLLRIVAVYCILDGLQVVFVGAIKGAGDTFFVLFMTCFISIAAVVIGLIWQACAGPGLMLWWYVVAGWVGAMGIAFWARYVSGRWEVKRVIETTAMEAG